MRGLDAQAVKNSRVGGRTDREDDEEDVSASNGGCFAQFPKLFCQEQGKMGEGMEAIHSRAGSHG